MQRNVGQRPSFIFFIRATEEDRLDDRWRRGRRQDEYRQGEGRTLKIRDVNKPGWRTARAVGMRRIKRRELTKIIDAWIERSAHVNIIVRSRPFMRV